MTNDKDMPCDCHSYNGETGKTPEVIAFIPDDSKREICLDACISKTVQELWRRGIMTEGSCCGHNKLKPSIVVSQGVDMKQCKEILDKIDQRDWEISQWQRVVYAKPTPAQQEALEALESARKYYVDAIRSISYKQSFFDDFDYDGFIKRIKTIRDFVQNAPVCNNKEETITISRKKLEGMKVTDEWGLEHDYNHGYNQAINDILKG